MTYATPGALTLNVDLTKYIRRHHCGDWGEELCSKDKEANEHSHKDGTRLLHLKSHAPTRSISQGHIGGLSPDIMPGSGIGFLLVPAALSSLSRNMALPWIWSPSIAG
jgi:hypothetical protein